MSDAAAQRRARQTVINLALSLLATLGLVLAIVLMVPRDDSSKIQHIDYLTAAKQTASSTGFVVPVPSSLPAKWWSNKAEWKGNPADAVPSFEAGFVSPTNTYVGETIGYNANPTWVALKMQGTTLTSAFVSGGSHWDVYTSTTPHDPAKDMDYVLVRQFGNGNYILLFGNATHTEVHKFANLIDQELK